MKKNLENRQFGLLHPLDYITPSPASENIKENNHSGNITREITRAQRLLITILYQRWHYGRNLASGKNLPERKGTEEDQGQVGCHPLRECFPIWDANEENPGITDNITCSGGSMNTLTSDNCVNDDFNTLYDFNSFNDFNNQSQYQDRDDSNFERWLKDQSAFFSKPSRDPRAEYYRTDSQQILSILSNENVGIVGSVSTPEGRKVVFRDGLTNISDHERGLDANISIFSYRESIIRSISAVNTKLTSTYDTCKLMAGTPLAMIPNRLYKAMERMDNLSHQRTKYRKTGSQSSIPTLEEATGASTDTSEASLMSIYSREANRVLKCLYLYRDQYCHEIFLMDIHDCMEDVLQQVSRQDRSRLETALMVQEENGRYRHYEYNTRRVWNLEDWCTSTSRAGVVRNYPEDSSSEDYVNVCNVLMTSKFENVRRASPDPLHYLPWSMEVNSDFAWRPETLVHEWCTFTIKYPELLFCEFKPTSFMTYQRGCADSMRKLSGRSSPNVLDRPMFDSPKPPPDSARYEFNPDVEKTPPRGMDKTIRFKTSGENTRRYKFYAEDENGMYYEVHDRDKPKKERNAEYLYKFTAPDDVFRLTATESSADSKDISTGHREARKRRTIERERVRKEMKYDPDESMDTDDQSSTEKPFLAKKNHKVVTLSDDEDSPKVNIKATNESNSEDQKAPSASGVETPRSETSSESSSSDDEAPPLTEKAKNDELARESYKNSMKLENEELETKREVLEDDINALEKKLGQMGTSKKKKKRIQSWDNQRRLRQQAARLNGVKKAMGVRARESSLSSYKSNTTSRRRSSGNNNTSTTPMMKITKKALTSMKNSKAAVQLWETIRNGEMKQEMRERKKGFTPKAGNIRDSDPNRTQPIPSGSTGNIINSGIITNPPFSSDLQSCQGHHVYNLLQGRFDTYRYSSCSISTILRTHSNHEKSRQDLQYPARPMADMGTSLNSPRPVMCHIDIISHFPGREVSVPLEITSSPVENVCAWQPRRPEMPIKQVIIYHYFWSNILFTLNMTPLSTSLPTGRSLREHKIRDWRLRKHITTLRIKITMQPAYGQGKRHLVLVLSHSECSFNFMNTDTISVKIDQDSNFIRDSLVFTLSTLQNRTGLTIPLTVSSPLRCPLSSPPTLLLTPVSTAGILTKAREVHASSEGLDEAQSADEDSYYYFTLFPCVCIV